MSEIQELSPLHDRIVNHVRYAAKSHQSSFIGAYVRPETMTLIHNGVIDLVAELENWMQPVNYSTANFEIANQHLYLRCGILIEVFQRPVLFPGEMHIQLDVEKYTRFYFEWAKSEVVPDNY